MYLAEKISGTFSNWHSVLLTDELILKSLEVTLDFTIYVLIKTPFRGHHRRESEYDHLIMRQSFLVTPELFRDYNLKGLTRVRIPTVVQYGEGGSLEPFFK